MVRQLAVFPTRKHTQASWNSLTRPTLTVLREFIISTSSKRRRRREEEVSQVCRGYDVLKIDRDFDLIPLKDLVCKKERVIDASFVTKRNASSIFLPTYDSPDIMNAIIFFFI